MFSKTHIRLEIDIEICLLFNQSEKRKPISSLVNFALIGQKSIQFQFQSLVWYRLKGLITLAITN